MIYVPCVPSRVQNCATGYSCPGNRTMTGLSSKITNKLFLQSVHKIQAVRIAIVVFWQFSFDKYLKPSNAQSGLVLGENKLCLNEVIILISIRNATKMYSLLWYIMDINSNKNIITANVYKQNLCGDPPLCIRLSTYTRKSNHGQSPSPYTAGCIYGVDFIDFCCTLTMQYTWCSRRSRQRLCL